MRTTSSLRSTKRAIGVGALALALVALAGGVALSGPAADLHANAADKHDAWLGTLNGKYRQLFDAPSPYGGIPLVHVLNYYNTLNSAFTVADKDIDAVLTFYGKTTIHGLNDASIFSGLLAQSRGLDARAMYEDMKANILPNVTLVPAMVIAIGQAQNHGLTYHRQ